MLKKRRSNLSLHSLFIASQKLRELSRHVTIPFELIGWIPTPTPFRLESLAHAHFAEARIRHAGAGTEFFRINAAAARAYCDAGVAV